MVSGIRHVVSHDFVLACLISVNPKVGWALLASLFIDPNHISTTPVLASTISPT